jgi:hypothetical protein
VKSPPPYECPDRKMVLIKEDSLASVPSCPVRPAASLDMLRRATKKETTPR